MERVTPRYKIELARELRRRQTPSEAKLWGALRKNQLNGLGFRRQHPIGRFVADFCCESKKMVVEIDGKYHNAPEQEERDRERAAHFVGRGYSVLRLTADDVMGRLIWVTEMIVSYTECHTGNVEEQVLGNDSPLPEWGRGGVAGEGARA